MTLTEARKALAGPLVFGDVQQVTAVRVVEMAEAIGEVLARYPRLAMCLKCDGAGEHTCSCGDDHECAECWGLGLMGDAGATAELDRFPDELVLEVFRERMVRRAACSSR